ncbi:MAG: cation transporter [Bacteroidia bacterium]|nr:cation transporter [Bacteroidia bacterium]
MARRNLSVFSVVFLLAVTVWAGKLQAQRPASFKVDGPCLNCGSARIMSILNSFDGVSNIKLDLATKTLTFSYDPVAISLLDLQLELSINGYDAGDFKRSANSGKDACCNEQKTMRGDESKVVLGLDEAGPADEGFEEEDDDLFDLDEEFDLLKDEELNEELKVDDPLLDEDDDIGLPDEDALDEDEQGEDLTDPTKKKGLEDKSLDDDDDDELE